MITIKNMSMPTSCEYCRCTFNGFDGSTECKLGAKSIDWLKRPKDCPLVEIESPQGEWIFKNGKYRCSQCGEKAIYRFSGSLSIAQTELLTDFCPNCGADMRGDNND